MFRKGVVFWVVLSVDLACLCRVETLSDSSMQIGGILNRKGLESSRRLLKPTPTPICVPWCRLIICNDIISRQMYHEYTPSGDL